MEPDSSLQSVTYVITSIMFTIGTVSFFVRFYCRMLITNAFGWDDTLAIFLMVGGLSTALAAKRSVVARLLGGQTTDKRGRKVCHHHATNSSLHVHALRMRLVCKISYDFSGFRSRTGANLLNEFSDT